MPNIASINKRAPGISKGLWKKELKTQLTGEEPKRARRGMRTHHKEMNASKSKEPREKRSKDKAPKDKAKLLGKRKSSTLHKSNTSTFKSQKKGSK